MKRIGLTAYALGLLAATFIAPRASAFLGAPDLTFATRGVQVLDLAIPPGPPQSPDFAHALAIQADGRIVVAGETNMGFMQVPFAIVRLHPLGAYDTSFADQGKQYGYFADSPATSKATGVAIQPDGRIVVAGSWSDGTTSNMGVARYSAAGVLEARVMTPIAGPSEARALRLQPDGKILVAGRTGNPRRIALVRYNADLTLDTTFNSTGKVVTALGSGGDSEAHAMALHADGRIVVAGYAPNAGQVNFAVVRYNPNGSVESSAVTDMGSAFDEVAGAVAIQDDGRIIVAGNSGTDTVVARFNAPGVVDNSFGPGGKFVSPGSRIIALALQPDGRILALTLGFEVWRMNTTGSADITFGIGGRVKVPLKGMHSSLAMTLQADGKVVVAGGVHSGASNDVVVARIDPAATVEPTPLLGMLNFGAQSMNTTSLPQDLYFMNNSGTSVPLKVPGGGTEFFVTAGTCNGTSLPAHSICAMKITFRPNAPGARAALLPFDDFDVTLTGIGERSLVIHYYRSILGRVADQVGKGYWESEATRVSGLGASVNEVWFSMAQTFFSSGEYGAFSRTNTGFVTDLYTTFFNRDPDPAGVAYWVGNLGQGMPREVALTEFMLSPEFKGFAAAIFGNSTARAEMDAVMDFYRGMLARLPDDGGLAYWAGRFRAAQCQNAAAVTAEADAVSKAFLLSGEYIARGRSNPQYVGDLYNAFLRRGGDLAGVLYWIDQLATGAQTREQLRVQFRSSPEFQARVKAIVDAGCTPS